ncbi:MAG: T9SS type A sorting domain-containing protein [Ignavibacteriales bacterium]|nr:T9SS type A sorting domain-containing protein [Ignavibacteriales bacterium]
MIETRPEIGEGQIYDLQLKNVSNENVTLKIEGLNNYPGYDYYLVDNSLNNMIKLNEGFELNIASGIKEKDYSLIIGTESFIEKLKDDFTPKQFALMQNYPNPFNPGTVIRYSIPTITLNMPVALPSKGDPFVQLRIYDILGNEVATLVNEQQSPGTYEVEFDARTTNHKQLTSGVYFYTLRAGNFTETRKMILLR